MAKGRRSGLAAVVIATGWLWTGGATAQGFGPPDDGGALLFHGNYCGPGNRAGAPPIDALDLACMHHDACSPDLNSGQIVHCACNGRLAVEAGRVARDPAQPDDLRALAQSVALGTLLLPCR